MNKDKKKSTASINVDMFPELKEVKLAKQKYIDKKEITGYCINIKGVGNHFQDGVNWALNYLRNKIKNN